jgi:lysozyme family protein
MNFNEAIPIVLKHEGGYVNNPADKGGETNFGIASRFHSLEKISKIIGRKINSMRELTLNDAVLFYKNEFWDKYKIDNLKAELRLPIFDMFVNMGAGGAIEVLQKVLGREVNRTVSQIPVLFNSINTLNSQSVLDSIKEKRIEYYKARGIGNQEQFLKGWINRTLDVANQSVKFLQQNAPSILFFLGIGAIFFFLIKNKR